MARYLDRVRRISALLFVVGAAIVFLAVQPESSYPVQRLPVYALLLSAVATGAVVYRFPWDRHDPNWFLVVGVLATGMIALLIFWTGGRDGIFFPFFVLVVVASGAYYTTVPLVGITAVASLGALSYLIYTPVARDDLLRSAVEVAMLVVTAFFANTIFRGLLRSDEGTRRMLADASALLGAPLDAAATLDRLARLAVPALGDCCLIDLVEPDGTVRDRVLVAENPATGDLLRRVLAAYPAEQHFGALAVRRGAPAILSGLDGRSGSADPSAVDPAALPPPTLALLRRAGILSAVAVPLRARERTLGAITLGATSTPRRYDAGDVAQIEELARRAALAVDNARLYQSVQAELTERRRVESALHESQERYRSLFEGLPIGLYRTTPDGQILDANPALVRMLGFPDRESLLRVRTQDMVDQEDRAAEQALLERDGVARCELRLTRRDGTPFWAEDIVRVVRDDAGQVVALEGSLQDITERKRAEQALQESLQFRDAFLSAAAHDLKNPLTAATVQTQMLRQRLRRGEDPLARLETGAERIETAIAKMRRIIDELQDVARLEIGRPLELDLEPTDLVELARQVAAEAGQGSSHHRIRVEAPDEPVVGEWDPARLDRVLTNLLGNAVKYSPAGGEIVVRVGLEEDGRWAVLSVRDPGIGIPAADLPRIFERYHRGANARRIVGTGIGLAGASQIVAQHGGTIAAESQEGRGSTFTIRLPTAAAPAVEETASAAPSSA